jgi:DNA gyrase subunit A
MDVIEPGGQLLIVTEHGFGKRSDLKDYPVKGRATGGVATIDQKHLDKVGHISSARVVQEEDEVTLVSSGGVMLRLKVKDISSSGRATRGFRLMDLGDEDQVASLARINTKAILIEEDTAPVQE